MKDGILIVDKSAEYLLFVLKLICFFFFFNVHEERRGKYLKIKGNQRPETIV